MDMLTILAGLFIILLGFYIGVNIHFLFGLVIAIIGGRVIESCLKKKGYLGDSRPAGTGGTSLDDETPSESHFDPAEYQDFLDYNAKLDAESKQSHRMSHAEWVEKDSQKHKKWAQEEEQAWAEDFMDEMDDRGKW